MSAWQEELIAEQDAARYLGVSPERLRELATKGELRLVMAPGPQMLEPMCFRGEVLRLKERLRGQEGRREVTKDDLVETITHAIQQLGFARIHVSAILKVFSPNQKASFAIQDELQNYAESHGWAFQRESQDFIAFYPNKNKDSKEMINQNNIIIGDRVRMRYGNHVGEIATVTNITWHSAEHGGLYPRFNISFEGGEADDRGMDSLEKVKESDNDSALTASAGH